ncbi:unnamed protein product, partial [Bubo scandiacus]
ESIQKALLLSFHILGPFLPLSWTKASDIIPLFIMLCFPFGPFSSPAVINVSRANEAEKIQQQISM